jgi:hypothetical protein
MDTDLDIYTAWLEIQLEYEKLEEEWRNSRRGNDGSSDKQRIGREEETTTSSPTYSIS